MKYLVLIMVNVKGGKKHKRQKKNKDEPDKRNLIQKQEGMEYGIVIKALGSCRFTVNCCDGAERLAQLRTGDKKKFRIMKDDWVLVGLRDYDTFDKKCDILCRYFPDEVRQLKNLGEINIIGDKNTIDDQIVEKEEDIEDDCAFDFDDI